MSEKSKKTKSIEQQYKVLDELEHIRLRVGMYAGSPVIETREEYVYEMANKRMQKRPISYVPALVKVISEAIDNVVDEHKRNPTVLNVLKVDYDQAIGEISIQDNGGIPVKIHAEFGKYVPEIIFGMLRSGSNYDDSEDQAVIGTNGLGVKLLNVLSKKFVVTTADGESSFKQQFLNGMTERSEPVIRDCKQNYTKLSFIPDYEYFKLDGLDNDHVAKIIRRLVDVAGSNPDLKIYINGDRIAIKSFEDYVALYTDEYVFENVDGWNIAVAHSADNNFQQTSFVNSVETFMGGTHVDYVTNQITNSLREYFKKKQKVDVKPGDIRGHLHMFISCSINRPKFSSQTKENMISAVSDWGTSYSVSDKFIRKVTQSHVIQSVLDWVEAKRIAQERAELKKLAKTLDKSSPKNVPKFNDASTKDRKRAMLMLCEGDSAKSGIMAGRNTSTMGVFPLRGKPINVFEMTPAEVIANKEFQAILTLTGLKIGEEVLPMADGKWLEVTVDGKKQIVNENDASFTMDGIMYSLLDTDYHTKEVVPTANQFADYNKRRTAHEVARCPDGLYFGRICIATDADPDGAHIQFLVMNMFYKFWPELYNMGAVVILSTPLAKVTYKKKELSFYSMDELDAWRNEHSNESFVTRYLKGLGSSKESEWKDYLSKDNLSKNVLSVRVTDAQDAGIFEMLFSGDCADRRKEWLNIEELSEEI